MKNQWFYRLMFVLTCLALLFIITVFIGIALGLNASRQLSGPKVIFPVLEYKIVTVPQTITVTIPDFKNSYPTIDHGLSVNEQRIISLLITRYFKDKNWTSPSYFRTGDDLFVFVITSKVKAHVMFFQREEIDDASQGNKKTWYHLFTWDLNVLEEDQIPKPPPSFSNWNLDGGTT